MGFEDEESKARKVTELADVIGNTSCGRVKMSKGHSLESTFVLYLYSEAMAPGANETNYRKRA